VVVVQTLMPLAFKTPHLELWTARSARMAIGFIILRMLDLPIVRVLIPSTLFQLLEV
jgi:hypothetical protein